VLLCDCDLTIKVYLSSRILGGEDNLIQYIIYIINIYIYIHNTHGMDSVRSQCFLSEVLNDYRLLDDEQNKILRIQRGYHPIQLTYNEGD